MTESCLLPTFETERFILREWVPEDAERISELLKDPRIRATNPAMPGNVDVEAILGRIEANRMGYASALAPLEQGGRWLIEPKSHHPEFGSLAVGSVRVGRVSQTEAELGIWVGTEFSGKGVSSEVLETIIEETFLISPFSKLLAVVLTKNLVALKLMDRFSFSSVNRNVEQVYHGVIVERVNTFELTKEEWLRKKKLTQPGLPDDTHSRKLDHN